MNKFREVFDAGDWLAFFANRKLKLSKECTDNLEGYFILGNHVTDMSNGTLAYLLSESSSHINIFLHAGRNIGCDEIGPFVEEIKNIFHPNPFPCDFEQRRAQLMLRLRAWDEETEPFAELEGHRMVFVDLLQSYVELRMLASSELFLKCTALYDPFEGNKALKKLKKQLQR